MTEKSSLPSPQGKSYQLTHLTALWPGDQFIVGKNGEVATVVRSGSIDRYDYHDAPDWCFIETEEYDYPFHFDSSIGMSLEVWRAGGDD